MYAIVADVERYPQFVPWCTGTRILRREPAGSGEVIWAEMRIGYKALREHYTSRAELDPIDHRIDVTQTEGPFRRLENHWHFTPLEQGCRVDFSLVFEFRNRILGQVAAAVLGPVMSRMTHAFEHRAKHLSEKALKKL